MANTKLYVGNLPWAATRDNLYELFGGFGQVQDAFIPLDRESGRSRGFGFVTLTTEDEAKAAIDQLDGHDFMGRQLKVNMAAPQGERGGGGGGRSGRGGYGGGGGGYGDGGYNQGGGGGGYGGGGY